MIGDDQKLYVCACIRKVTTKLQVGGQLKQGGCNQRCRTRRNLPQKLPIELNNELSL